MTVTDLGRSRSAPSSGYFGPLPDELWEVIDRAWYDPPSIQSNYSRERAQFIALAASLGWITIIAPDGLSLSRSWHVTFEGLTAYRNKDILSCSSSSTGS